jgi:voltage-gated potassium channel
MGQTKANQSRTRAVGGGPISHLDESFDTRRKLIVSTLVLIGLLMIGMSGFIILGENRSLFDGLYITVVILTTVGMKEGVHTLNPAEQGWAIVLMLAGISTALYVAGNLVAFIIEGDLRRILGRRQLQRQIDQLSGHIVVCGFGRMGRALCSAFTDKGAPFVVIDNDPESIKDADEYGYLAIQGDAMNEASLMRTRVNTAKGLAACLGTDANNVFVTLTARGMNDKLTIIARAEHEDTQPKLKRAGANQVICPPLLGANKIKQMFLNPAVDELMDIATTGSDIEISKVRIAELKSIAGKSLREIDLRNKTGLMVVAVIHDNGQRTFSPGPDAVLLDNDTLLVVGPTGSVTRLLDTFGEES